MRNKIKIGLFLGILFPLTSLAGDFDNVFKLLIQQRVEQSNPKPPADVSAQTTTKKAGVFGSNEELLSNVLLGGSKTKAEEEKMGREVIGSLLSVSPLLMNGDVQTYVNKVGTWVASSLGKEKRRWVFGVVDSPDVNAFSAPGGYVVITRGLYELLENEAELASVLAHEIGHVHKKHHLEIMQKSSVLGLLGNAVAKKVEGKNESKALGFGAEVFARKMDKSAEFEADRMAIVLTARSGYDPFAYFSVLQKISGISKSDSRIALLFDTHPAPDERIEMLSAAMGEKFDDFNGQVVAAAFIKLSKK